MTHTHYAILAGIAGIVVGYFAYNTLKTLPVYSSAATLLVTAA